MKDDFNRGEVGQHCRETELAIRDAFVKRGAVWPLQDGEIATEFRQRMTEFRSIRESVLGQEKENDLGM